ncbi:MAG: transcriptional modulator of MazE/toxin, MazF [Ignavibacteria bacterium]|nr:transcriptional modulator of MazE/toxin, MazF [Ignavibacteria bacterium]
MEEFVKGDVIVFSYPFSDFSSQKRRPALVIASPTGNDLIVCQITSQNHFDNYSIRLENNDFLNGSLQLTSFIRPNKIISVDKSIITYKAGNISSEKLKDVIDSVIEIIKT